MDVEAEDLPPLELGREAVELYHVALTPVTTPPGLQPMWIMSVPDGRPWPPEFPPRLGLYAGEKPEPSPAGLLLYSDHKDGICPLYEVPREEAASLATRENQAAVLYMDRKEMYDLRHKVWQKRPAGWQLMWFVRQVDLEPGDTVLGCLRDVKRSRRAPADLPPAPPEALVLLDDAGQRVAASGLTADMLPGVAKSLGDVAQGVPTDAPGPFLKGLADHGTVGLTAWTAPTRGRYQVWAALGTDKCAARCLVWISGR